VVRNLSVGNNYYRTVESLIEVGTYTHEGGGTLIVEDSRIFNNTYKDIGYVLNLRSV